MLELKPKIPQKYINRFWTYVDKTDDCWHWLGSQNNVWGYGQFGIQGKTWRAHRLAYLLETGDLPNILDHLCRNRLCVNPAHLESVTQKENVMRGLGITSKNSKKVNCWRGHPLSGGNLYITPMGHRNCKLCRNLSVIRYRDKQRSIAWT